MEIVVDKFNDFSEWVASGEGITLAENKFQEHLIDGGSSLRVVVASDSKDEYFERVFDDAIEINGIDSLRFFVSKYGKSKGGSFSLKVAIGDTAEGVFTPKGEWFVPVLGKQVLEMINVEVKDIVSFNTIRFTVLDDYAETWWIDYIILCEDEFVIDSLVALKDELNLKIDVPLGALGYAASEGDKSINLPDWANVGKYSLLKITEGENEEYHFVAGEVSNGKVAFENESIFDGESLLNDYTSAAVISLVVPCFIAGKDAPYAVPGIYISGLVPILPPDGSINAIFDSYTISGTRRRISPRRDLILPVEIEVLAVAPEIMVMVNNFIHNVFHNEGRLLVNGTFQDIEMEDDPKYDPGDVEGEVPYSLHYYSIRIIDVFNSAKSYVTIPESFTYNLTLQEKDYD